MRRILGAIVLAVCIAAPTAEMFDQWDPAQGGNDTESDLVLVAVCIGIGLIAAAAILRRVRSITTAYVAVRPPVVFLRVSGRDFLLPTLNSSPPLALRI